jgi:putative NADH-flavin reductase
MELVVLGATGPTGQLVTTQALKRGWGVTALVRDPTRLQITNPRLTVAVGDATKPEDLEDVIGGADAVVSALGSGKSRRSTVASAAARAVIETCGRAGVNRLVWLSALGVGASAADGSAVQRLLWRALMGQVFSDKKVADEAIAASQLDYTLVYPATLSNGPATGTAHAREHLRLKGMPTVSRADVAAFMLDAVADKSWIRQTAELTR